MQVTHVKSVTIADQTGTVTFWDGTTTGSVAATAMQRPSDWNSGHALQFTLAGNTTYNSTVSGTAIPFRGEGGVSIGGSNGSLVFKGNEIKEWRPFELGNNTSFSAIPNGTLSLQHFVCDEYVPFRSVEIWARGTFASSSNSQSASMQIDYGIYTQGAGASSTQWTRITSNGATLSASYNSNTAAGYTFQVAGTTLTVTSNATANVYGFLSGPMHYYFPLAGTLTPGVRYALGLVVRHGGATQAGSFQPLIMTMMNSRSMGRLSLGGTQAATVSVIGDRELGTRGTASLPATYAMSDLGVGVSRQVLYVQFED